MAANKKPYVNIGVIGHGGYSRKDLDLAIKKVLSSPKDSVSFASVGGDLNLKKAVIKFNDNNPFEELEKE